MDKFNKLFDDYMSQVCDQNPDPSHDIHHVRRVVQLAEKLARKEGAKLEVVVPAAYLHDCVYISKTDSRRSESSKISASKALELLNEWNYPEMHFEEIAHAIEAHSFSAGIPAQTIEAKVVQDADRLDAIGAIGIFRCFAFSGVSKRPLYSSHETFSKSRVLDDKTNTLDHFYTKLLHLPDLLQTHSAKKEGEARLATMRSYLKSLEDELFRGE